MRLFFQALLVTAFAVGTAFFLLYLYAYAGMLLFFYNMFTTVDVPACFAFP
jgi:hypothetical protein